MAWLYKRPDSGKWWIGWRVNGKQFLQSTGETDRKKAEEKLQEFNFLHNARSSGKLTEQLIESLTGSSPTPKITLKTCVAEWLKECEGSTAEATLAKYQKVADELSVFVNASDKAPLLRDISTDVLRSFLIRKRATVTASTANLYRTILAVFFIWAVKNSKLTTNPVAPIKVFKQSRDEGLNRRPFTLSELKRIYDKAPDLFWRYMISGGFYTGLRMGDLITIPKGAVDFERNEINILTRKTGKTVHIPIAQGFRKVLEEVFSGLPKTTKASDYVWPEQAERYERLKAKVFSNQFYEQILVPAGLASPRTHEGKKNGRSGKHDYNGLSFHSLRHTNVTFLKATGSNSEVAKALVGHSSDEINNLYTHLPMDVLSKAVNQLPAFEQSNEAGR